MIGPGVIGLVILDPALGDDILDRYDALVRPVVNAALANVQLNLEPSDPGASRWWLLPVAARVSLDGSEAMWFSERQSGASLHVGSQLGTQPYALDEAARLMRRMQTEPRGVGSYRALGQDFQGLFRVEAVWKHWSIAADTWIIRYDRRQRLYDWPGEPWNGKWAGAYSLQWRTVSAPPATTGGPLSGLLLIEGGRAALHLSTGDWQTTMVGTVVGDAFSGQSPEHAESRVYAVTGAFEDGKRVFRAGVRIGDGSGRELATGKLYLTRISSTDG